MKVLNQRIADVVGDTIKDIGQSGEVVIVDEAEVGDSNNKGEIVLENIYA